MRKGPEGPGGGRDVWAGDVPCDVTENFDTPFERGRLKFQSVCQKGGRYEVAAGRVGFTTDVTTTQIIGHK